MKFLKDIQKDGMEVGAGIAGGALARVFTNKVGDKIPYIKDKPKLKPVGSFLIGLLAMGNTKGTMREVGRGAAIVAGVDILSGYVPMVANNAINEDLNGLADELADELENRLNDDVNSGKAAVNDSVDNSSAAVNEDMNEDLSEDLNEDLSEEINEGDY